jgi:hypothetical protein
VATSPSHIVKRPGVDHDMSATECLPWLVQYMIGYYYVPCIFKCTELFKYRLPKWCTRNGISNGREMRGGRPSLGPGMLGAGAGLEVLPGDRVVRGPGLRACASSGLASACLHRELPRFVSIPPAHDSLAGGDLSFASLVPSTPLPRVDGVDFAAVLTTGPVQIDDLDWRLWLHFEAWSSRPDSTPSG